MKGRQKETLRFTVIRQAAPLYKAPNSGGWGGMPVEGCLALTCHWPSLPRWLAALHPEKNLPQLVVQVVPALGADVNVVCRAGCVCWGVREGGPLCKNLAL